jgi:uncharacterized repeat protein (TIGR01451 family)
MSALVAAVLAAVGLTVGIAGAEPAQAASSPSNAPTYGKQTFYAYAKAGELPRYTFTEVTGQAVPVTVTTTDPSGVVQQVCTVPASSPVNTTCASSGLTPSVAGIWTVTYDPNSSAPAARFSWDIMVVDSANTPIPGRVWVTNLEMGQPNGARSVLTFWIGTREGYAYAVTLYGYGGIVSGIASNGFGLVTPGTCTPLYHSAQLNDPTASFSDACGDRYKLFLEAPAADLPASALLPDGTTDWVRPEVVPPAATNLTLAQDGPLSRAGHFEFDLAGVNGGYTIQLDTNDNGVYTDPVDRTITWGSPPGHVSVPFDGLDGQGDPLSVCTPMNAKVVVDRVGEAHLVMSDVEQFYTSGLSGVRIQGATPGLDAPNPKLYWNDTNLVGGGTPMPYADGRAGVDTSASAAHGWTSWGDQRAIENWTYYQAQAGAQTTIPAACSPALTLRKDGTLHDTNGNGFADPGETIDYSFTVRNTGNTPVSGVTVDDDRVSAIAPASADIPVLGEQVFTAAPYTVTQGDVDAGGVTNVASASGVDPRDTAVVSNEDTHFVPTPPRTPALTLDKRAQLSDTNGNDLADQGETIAYSFVVKNTGNTTLTGVSIADPRVTGVTPATATLAPGESTTFTAAPYTVTQADIRTGSVDNTALANATSPIGPVSSNTDSVSTPTPTPDPRLELDKTASIGDTNTNGKADPGEVITYTFHVHNAGNIDVSGVHIVDPRVASTTPTQVDIPAGGSADFTATYTARQSDVDAGSIPNTARADGTYLDGGGQSQPISSAPDSVVVPTPDRAPALTIDKTGTLHDTNGNGVADVGEKIDYAFTVTNTGNTTLDGVSVVDARVATITPSSATLAPGDDEVFASPGYVVTQADVDAGKVANTAFARGHIPGGDEIYSTTATHVEPVASSDPALTLKKTATLTDTNGDGRAEPSETISYAFVVTNTGNVTLTDVTVNDKKIAGLTPASVAFLTPAQSFTFTSDPYVITAADADAGKVVNVATATARTPTGDPIDSPESSATTTVSASRTVPALASSGISDPTAAALFGLGLAGIGLALAARRRRRRATP